MTSGHELWADLVIDTHNPGGGDKAAKLNDLIAEADAGADVIIGQEFADLYIAVTKPFIDLMSCKPKRNRFGVANPHSEVPIFYRKGELRMVWWHQFLVRIGLLGPNGAGQDFRANKQITITRFVHKPSGRRINILNFHPVPSAFSTSGAEGDRRKAAWKRQIVDFFKRAGRPRSGVAVVGGGDLNAELDNRLLREQTPSWWTWDGRGPTLRNRDVDHIGHREAHHTDFRSTTIIETHGSIHRDDHRIRRNRYRLRLTALKRRARA